MSRAAAARSNRLDRMSTRLVILEDSNGELCTS